VAERAIDGSQATPSLTPQSRQWVERGARHDGDGHQDAEEIQKEQRDEKTRQATQDA
jgi:hypothetical protein